MSTKSRPPRLLPFIFIFGIGAIVALFAAPWREQTVHAMICVTLISVVGLVGAYLEDVTLDDDDDI